MNVLDWINGKKTYIAALGLFGLSLYKASQGDVEGALMTFSQALAAFGLRHAIAKGS
jgi:hypothetical protein